MLDCAVIGGGPGGLTAGIYLGRFRRTVMVFDTGKSRAEWIPRSHNMPGFPRGVRGPVLLRRMRAQARRYGAGLQEREVRRLSKDADGAFTLDADGEVLRAKTVLLATGVAENAPALPHIAEAVKSGVIRVCPICDGYESMGRNIAVVGEDDHAANEALFLRTYTDQLTLILAGPDSRISEERRSKLAEAGIAMLKAPLDTVSLEDGCAVCTAGGETRRFHAVYSAFGITPRSQLAEAVGAKLDSDGRLVTDAHMQTSVDGLYAVGDLVRGLNQISVSTGEAAIAATAIHNRLPRTWG